jgi:hypothetical protein
MEKTSERPCCYKTGVTKPRIRTPHCNFHIFEYLLPSSPFSSYNKIPTPMSSLPSTPFVLHGGCFCKAITYTISVPALSSRPPIPDLPTRPFGPQTTVAERLPMIDLDHCNSCRRVAGAIVQCWIICPQRWVTFSLLSRTDSTPGEERITSLTTEEVLCPSKELEERTFVKGFDSSEHAHRTFCGRCGTPLSYQYSGSDDEMTKEENWGPYVDIALGTLEKESVEMEGMRPGRQGWFGDGIEWVKKVFDEGGKSL